MPFEGMDVGEVDRLATKLQLQAAAVEAVVAVIDTAVASLAGVWAGEGLHVFHAMWHQTHRPKAASLSADIGHWVAELRQQSKQQWATSGGFVGTAGHGPGTYIRSSHSQQWVLAMASLSKAAYGDDGARPKDFHPYTGDPRYPDGRVHGALGFDANIYQYAKPDGSVGYVIAYRGSDDPLDWFGNNIPDREGILTYQYAQAAEFARSFVRDHPNADVTFTGHSLGGGLASVSSIATGRPAITFNAAAPGYSDVYYAEHPGQLPTPQQVVAHELGLDPHAPDTSNITSFRTADDPLSTGERLMGGDEAPAGAQHTLAYNHPQLSPLAAHNIDDVINSVKDDHSTWWKS